MDKPLGGKDKSHHHQHHEKDGKNGVVIRYTTPTVAQATVITILEAVSVIAQADCLANIPPGSSVPIIEPNGSLPPCNENKANLVARVAFYLTLPPSPAANASPNGGSSDDYLSVMASHQRVWFSTLRALASLCMGEPSEEDRVSTHPHLMFIVEAMSKMLEVRHLSSSPFSTVVDVSYDSSLR